MWELLEALTLWCLLLLGALAGALGIARVLTSAEAGWRFWALVALDRPRLCAAVASGFSRLASVLAMGCGTGLERIEPWLTSRVAVRAASAAGEGARYITQSPHPR